MHLLSSGLKGADCKHKSKKIFKVFLPKLNNLFFVNLAKVRLGPNIFYCALHVIFK